MAKRQEDAVRSRCKIQPFMTVLGKPEDITSVLICIDNHVWSIPNNSVLDGFEKLFQCFFVFNIEYPLPSRRLLVFIQLFLFRISTDQDSSCGISGLYELAHDVKLSKE